MLALFIRSLGLHFGWFFRSFWPGSHKDAPIGVLRILFLLLIYPGICSVQLIHWLGFLMDEILFPHYKKVEIKAPLFISGIPRSGTTFVHRTLVQNSTGFTCFKMWEAILAPSITERKCIRAIARIDKVLGGFARTRLFALLRKGTAALDDIHEVSLTSPEEDYLTLLPFGGCFIMAFAFPFSVDLRSLGQLETLNDETRERLLQGYHRCLQKHLFCAGENARLLSKNAAFSSWLPSLRLTYPDAKFIICIREPARALSSQLSSLAGARKVFGTDPDGRFSSSLMLDTFASNYRSLAQFINDTRYDGSTAVIEQSDLRKQPGALIAKAVEQLKLESNCDLERLHALLPSSPSAHKHQLTDYSVDSERMKVCIEPSYREILRSEPRISI